MRIFCCYSPAQEVLFQNYFKPSLPPDLELTATSLNVTGAGNYMDRDFITILFQRLDLVLQAIHQTPGECFIWSDIDIVFCRPVTAELQSLLDQSGADILFQRNARYDDEINGGFFVACSSSNLASFFERVKAKLRNHPDLHEQDIINLFLPTETGIKWDYLPWEYYVRNHGWPPPSRIAIYHAASPLTQGSDGLQQKINLLNEFYRIRKYGFPMLAWSCLLKAPARPKRWLKQLLKR